MTIAVLLAVALLVAPAAHAKNLMTMRDLETLVEQFGDEILTHQGLNSASAAAATKSNGVHRMDEEEEEGSNMLSSDLSRGIDDDVPHPVGVHNWGAHLKFGQISGVSIDKDDQPVVFHRGSTVWNDKSFDGSNKLVDRTPIPNDTIVILDPDTAEIKGSWGAGMFYMPHGITIDGDGNVFVTDVGLHQVMRFPAGSQTADIVLGEAFVPGSDSTHFCKPTKVVVSETTGIFFVADGYCNSRVLKYSKDGKLLKIINGKWNVIHSLALFEDEDVLCLSDREGQRIDCMKAGLRLPKQADKDETGEEVITYTGVGRSYAIAAKGTAILSVSGGPNIRGITIDTASEVPKILDQWGIEEGLTAPHDLAISQTGDAVYVAEIDPEKKINLHKFEVIRSADFF